MARAWSPLTDLPGLVYHFDASAEAYGPVIEGTCPRDGGTLQPNGAMADCPECGFSFRVDPKGGTAAR